MSGYDEDVLLGKLSKVLDKILDQKLEEQSRVLDKKLDEQSRTMNSKFAEQSSAFAALRDDLERRLGYVERAMGAIESYPAPYERPKSFQTATEFHSVSASIKTRRGHMG